MEIIPDEKNDEKLLNLILKEQPVDGILGHIVKYNSKVTERDSEYEIGQKGISSIIDIRDSGNVNTMRYAYIRVLVGHCINQPNQGGYCGGNPDHDSWTPACSTWYVISIPIDSGGGGGGGTSNDPPENNSGTGNNNGEPPGGTYENGGAPPVSTSPVPPANVPYKNFVKSLSDQNSPNYNPAREECLSSSDSEFQSQLAQFFNSVEIDENGNVIQSTMDFINAAIDLACSEGNADSDFNSISLQLLLIQNPALLIDIPCDQLAYWQQLAQYQLPNTVIEKVSNLQDQNSSAVPTWDIQHLNGAQSAVVNMDFFLVTITLFPINPSTGLYYSPQEFFDYFRRNINEFTAGTNVSFSPSDITGSDESAIWNSPNPLGAIVSINIVPDSGSVICSNYVSNSWIFTTLTTP